MILDAAAAQGLDLPASVMLGDKASDMRAAQAAGVGTRILLPADAAEAAAAPAGTVVLPEAATLRDALRLILGARAGKAPGTPWLMSGASIQSGS
jgi:D-glycero-D-manno-heptose 1,7-bisphosphate phosphatase